MCSKNIFFYPLFLGFDAPESGFWFFCEVRGRDSIREQEIVGAGAGRANLSASKLTAAGEGYEPRFEPWPGPGTGARSSFSLGHVAEG